MIPGMPSVNENAARLDALAGVAAAGAIRTGAPYLTLVLIGLGGLFAGVAGPLLSTFVPLLVRDALGDQRTLIGAVMAIDNVLLFLLVPWGGILSDRASSRGQGRLPLVLAGFGLTAAGIALLPAAAALGIGGLVAAIVVLYSGLNVQRSPFQALVADHVPSRYRSLGSASVTFQMCVGAIVFLMLGNLLGMARALQLAAATIVGIGVLMALGLRERDRAATPATEATFRSLLDAAVSGLRGTVPGLRSIFAASILLQMIFQSFTTWFALHGTDRFGIRAEDVTIGFIAWAVGGVIGALPAGLIGLKIGRRNAMLLGFALMLASFIALDRVSQPTHAFLLLAVASASWTLPSVNTYPLFIEQIPRAYRGVLAALFLLSMAVGGAVGDPLNGSAFDLAGAYRPLFLMMAAYTAIAIVIVLLIPRGAGEAGTGPEGA
jgi:MFS family permease